MDNDTKTTHQENILRILLMQRAFLLGKIQKIESNQSLSPEDKVQALAEVLNPVGKEKA